MLDDIGFYTMTEERAKQQSWRSPLWRCEIEITGVCNFKCPYCRGLPWIQGKHADARTVHDAIELWGRDGLKNIRFSGGEPTLHPDILSFVKHAREFETRVAVSTNGTAGLDLYEKLTDAGVSDWSISLDACCAGTAKVMTGGADRFADICEALGFLSHYAPYVTAGVVITDQNIAETKDTIQLALSFGVHDVRLIPAAQENALLPVVDMDLPANKYPILHYRLKHAREGIPVRGLGENDSHRCWLMRDDSCIVDDCHYPCVIYMREGGHHVGIVGPLMRQSRQVWFSMVDTHSQKICKNNCLDVCRDFNNRMEEINAPKAVD